MRLRTAAVVAVTAAGTAFWWHRRRRTAAPAVQLGLADGSVQALLATDAGELRELAGELRRASLADG
ncbi:MAG: hypothetical protein WC709_12705 [Thermoleophilia bacterium]